jgi:hypothetical protein
MRDPSDMSSLSWTTKRPNVEVERQVDGTFLSTFPFHPFHEEAAREGMGPQRQQRLAAAAAVLAAAAAVLAASAARFGRG